MKINISTLLDMFIYFPENGKLIWACGQRAGMNAGWICKSMANYKSKRVTINRKSYRLSHVVWAIANKEWPKDQIDHINGDPLDNRILNLRQVSNTENQKNSKRRTDNTSGVVGVSWNKLESRWKAYVEVSGSRISLGTFKDRNSAVFARKAAEKEYAFHPNHGR